jgi:hypothetical protein
VARADFLADADWDFGVWGSGAMSTWLRLREKYGIGKISTAFTLLFFALGVAASLIKCSSQNSFMNDRELPFMIVGNGMLVLLGMAMVRFPDFFWMGRYAMSVKNVEPTEFYLVSTRMSGGGIIALGIVFPFFN